MSQWDKYPEFTLFPSYNLHVNTPDRNRNQRTQEPIDKVLTSQPARAESRGEKGAEWV